MIRGVVKYLVLLMAGILSASCVFDADQCVIPVDEPRTVIFTVALDNQRTKAAWGDGYSLNEEGVPFDYRIIPENLRVVVYAQDGTPLGSIKDLYFWPENELHTVYRFMGEMPENFAEHFNSNVDDHRYRFMVLANCDDNMSGAEYITYSHTQLNPDNEEAAIPMWGVSETDLSALSEQSNHYIGQIFLLRAAAKIEVKLSDALKSKATTSIKSATLKYYNQTGYVLPDGWSQVTDTKKIDQENCLRLFRHAAVNMPLVKDETTGDFYVYVTEYDNQNYAGERNKISLEFVVNGVSKTFDDAISFCQYSGGKPLDDSDYNIIRNHIYEFEITGIAGSSLILDYSVADWDTQRWDSDGDGVLDSDYEEHDLSYPTYHNPVMPPEYFLPESDQSNYTITKSPIMYNSGNPSEGAFICYFQILGPVNVQWKPGITGSTENYRIQVFDKDDEVIFDTDGETPYLTESSNWYKIMVFPKNTNGVGNAIDFMITYYQSWTEQSIHLYINGEYDKIRWPESGDNPKIIKIKHVSK